MFSAFLPQTLPRFKGRLGLFLLLFLYGLLQSGGVASSSKLDILAERNSAKLKILVSILPEKLDQADVLKDLELRLASERDYRGAIQAKEERLALEKEIAAIESEMQGFKSSPSAQVHGAIELLPEDAALVGCTYQSVSQSIQNLSETSTVLWNLPPHALGGYEVIVTFSGPPTLLKVEEDFYYLQASTTNSGNPPKDSSLGTLRLKGESSQLKLTAPLGVSTLTAQIHKITLIPCEP